MNNDKISIFLVDDDALYLKVLENEFLQHADFNILTFPTGEHCIENLSQNPDVIVLDYYLDGIYENAMNGLETLDKIKSETGFMRLHKIISTIFQNRKLNKELNWYMERM